MIKLENVTKRYGDKTVYENFCFEIAEGEILCILGESGSGKTTLLNILAGAAEFGGRIEGNISPASFVYQRDRLIPNMTVKENVEFICKGTDAVKSLTNVGLADALDSYPKSLSAGMARRVGIVRAFLYPSEILLMDEPFINLDVKLKYSLIETVKKMKEESRKTVVCVTHDIKEAVMLADRIAVLKNGKIIYDVKEINEKTESELLGLMLK